MSTIDLTPFADMAYWSHGAEPRAAVFRMLRDEAPVVFMEEPEIDGFERGPGFWSVTRHADVVEVSRHPEVFCSGRGTNIVDLPQELSEFMGSMINMDAPRHTRLRHIVNKSFTPRMVNRIDEDVRVKARNIVAAAAGSGGCDVVAAISAPLPLQIICEMMGIPEHLWGRILELTNIVLGDQTVETDLGVLMAAVMEMAQIARDVGEDRLANPTDDLVSAMMHADVDGDPLAPMEMASFFILLAVAGNETTRNAISHGIRLLSLHPDQRERWMSDVDGVAPTAVEEVVRCASPVIHFRRTATQDVQLGGRSIKAGDKVVMWYESANRDERVFDDPDTFDVTRSPNEHVGFGGGGPHFCLGANLARREIRVMFEELFRWLPDIRATAEPEYLQSAFIHGIKSMPCEFTPTEVPRLDPLPR